MNEDNPDMALAFPSSVRGEVMRVLSALPAQEPGLRSRFSVLVSGESVHIPYRVTHDVASVDLNGLTDLQTVLLSCILTRHFDGFVRERHLARILTSNYEWVPPFVIQLVGEYVLEILCRVRDGLSDLDRNLYRDFLLANPAFFDRTKQRVRSYWYCYYTNVKKEDYAGFEIVRFLDDLVSRDDRRHPIVPGLKACS